MKDAEAHAEDDRKRREAAEVRNQGDSVLYQTEKQLNEHGSKLDENDRKTVDDTVSELKEALKGDDVDAIRSKTDAVIAASQKFAEALYQKAQTDDAQSSNGAGAPAEDDVVDAEVVDDQASA
jgi:molecular chaperone DnaK